MGRGGFGSAPVARRRRSVAVPAAWQYVPEDPNPLSETARERGPMTELDETPANSRPLEVGFVELHPATCGCGGFAGEGPWDSSRRRCDGGRRPAIRVVLDARSWHDLGSPRSDEAFREALDRRRVEPQ